MTCFPDKSVETIVAGLEAAISLLCAQDLATATFLRDPRHLDTMPTLYRADVLAIRDAQKRVRDLCTARYLRESRF